MRCLVARVPGCESEWNAVNTSLHSCSGTKGQGVLVEVSQNKRGPPASRV